MFYYKITLRGSHGGELDSAIVKSGEDDQPELQQALIALVTRCTFSPGDTISIDEVDEPELG